tara:strand:+ start:3367 stop:3558 length:192 start_codon:yes stop_codon:yes gene_type:complete
MSAYCLFVAGYKNALAMFGIATEIISSHFIIAANELFSSLIGITRWVIHVRNFFCMSSGIALV